MNSAPGFNCLGPELNVSMRFSRQIAFDQSQMPNQVTGAGLNNTKALCNFQRSAQVC